MNLVAILMYTILSADSDVITDNLLQPKITSICANEYVRTWATNGVYYVYCDLGGMLSRQQMLPNLTTHLGDNATDVIVEGSASVVGFKKLFGKSLTLVSR